MADTAETYAVKHGGLMRCCLASLDDEMLLRRDTDKPMDVEGEVIHCRYCSSSMICKDGTWQWNREELKPNE